MNISTTSLAASYSSPAASFSIQWRNAPAGTDDIDSRHVQRAQRTEHGGHGWSRRRAEHDDHGPRANAPQGAAGYTELKLKVEQTVGALAAAGPAPDAPASESTPATLPAVPAPASSAQFEAKMQLRVEDGRIDARIKLDMQSAGDGASFAKALDSFTTALYSALRMIFGSAGQDAATTPAQDGQPAPVAPVTPVAQLPAPTEAAAPSSTTAAAMTSVDGTTAAPAAAQAPTSTAALVPVAATADPPMTATANAVAPQSEASPAPALNGSMHISLRLRITYGGFENNMGALALKLSEGVSGSAQSGVGAAFADLLGPFAQLGKSAGFAPSASTLAAFLQSLSGAFKGDASGAPGAAAAELPAPAPILAVA